MVFDFLKTLKCIYEDEASDYEDILSELTKKDYHVALMPAIFWDGGICNLFDQKAASFGKDLIWIMPIGQANFCWLRSLREKIIGFYKTDKIEFNKSGHPGFPGVSFEEFEECILLRSDDLESCSEHTILGANIILIRLGLSSGRDALLFIVLAHQDDCWEKIIEKYGVSLKWLVDSGRGMGDYYVWTRLYKLMQNTPYPEILPTLYFKGLYNKGDVPESFKFSYSMFGDPDSDGLDDTWQLFSAVYNTGWND